MAQQLQEEADAASAAELQADELAATSPPRNRKRPAPGSSGKDKENAHCLSPEGALAGTTRRALGY